LAELPRRMAKWREEAAARLNSAERPIHMARLVTEMNQAMPDDSILVADGGFAAHWTGLIYDTKAAGRHYIANRGLASIGYGLPGGIGAALAAPDRPVVALMTPGKPTVVLSQPPAPKPMAGAVVVESVEIEPGGKFHASGRARPGGAVRLYLNDTFVASVTDDADGRFAVTINQGVAPGSYRVRLDEVEPNSGAMRARAEVPFNVPDTMVAASVPAQATASKRPDSAAAQPQLAAAVASVLPEGGSPSTVVVPKIATTTVSRGDSLWRLSRQTYGVGTRYSVIYKANREQIRNPNLIRPGQIFVLPAR